jgi:hypothetical protein
MSIEQWVAEQLAKAPELSSEQMAVIRRALTS